MNAKLTENNKRKFNGGEEITALYARLSCDDDLQGDSNSSLAMLELLENEELKKEAIRRMCALNKEILSVEDLNENYQIGAAYFLKLKTIDFDKLWTDYLQPLLQEYVRGMYDEKGIMDRFAKAYGYQKSIGGNADEPAQDQG